MTLLILFGVGCAYVSALFFFTARAFERGYKRGYEAGRAEGQFWQDAEKGVDQARKEIWKKEESA